MQTLNVKFLYAYKFISQCLPIYAFYAILFIERGLSVADVAVLIALWSLFSIIFQTPAGILADRWNRRNMLSISALLQGACFAVWFFSQTFFMFALGFLLWALSGTFASGTEEGLIYDNLKSDGREEDFTKVYGKAQFFANMGMVFAILSAGAVVSFVDIGSFALVSVGISLFSAVLALQIREKNYYAEQPKEKSDNFFKTFKEAASFLKGSTIALVSVLFVVLFASTIGNYLDEFDALIINDFGLDNAWVSVIFAVRFIFIAIGDILAPIVRKKVSSIRRIFPLSFLSYIVLAVFSTLWGQYVLLIFGFACMVAAISEILLIDTLQSEIKEEGRATVMSFIGVGQNIVMICFSLAYAWMVGVLPLQHVYIIISIYGVIGSLIFFLLFNRTN